MNIKISEKIKKINVNSPERIAEIMVKVLLSGDESDRKKEHFWGVYFNSKNNIIKIELISLGTLNASIVHPRELYYPAIKSLVGAMIAVHNHPSGDIEPSEDDIDITTRLKEAGKILGIEFYDHIIINEKGGFYSFKEKGLI